MESYDGKHVDASAAVAGYELSYTYYIHTIKVTMSFIMSRGELDSNVMQSRTRIRVLGTLVDP